MSEKYKVQDSRIPHFITCTIVDWVDVFTRPVYKDLIIDALRNCQKNKGLIVHAYCIMTNHVHFIVSADKDYVLPDIIRDFKRYTSRKIIEIMEDRFESRRKWMLKKFKSAADRIKRNKTFKLWKDGFHPIELSSNSLQDQRLEYLHQNPVKAGIVWSAEEYKYSSAAYYAGNRTDSLLDVDMIQ
jgi:REP element-mobilizing transposase RayT